MGRVEADNRAGVEAGSSDLDKDLRRAVGIVEIHADLVGALGGEAVDKERGGGEVLTPTAGDATHSRRRALQEIYKERARLVCERDFYC